jgi:redox-sensitive bicupin YhaK (pirin superfamily)
MTTAMETSQAGPNIQVIPAGSRGRTQLEWLDSRHTFSFGSWFDPARTGFGPLLVLNDDFVSPGGGFATHGHRDMEILTWVVEGALVHRDDLGSEGTIAAGQVQRMTAGTGIRHSEWNASDSDGLRFLQIWIRPETAGLAPSYEEREVTWTDGEPLRLVASRDGRDQSLTIHCDVAIHVARLKPGEQATHGIAEGRGLWVQMVSGSIEMNGTGLVEGDGAAVGDAGTIHLHATGKAEVLLLDVPLAAA